MKRNSLKVWSLLAVFALFLSACGGDMQKNEGEGSAEGTDNNGQVAAEATMDMDKVLDAYYDIKNALVSSDRGTAMIAANKLASRASGDVAAAAEEVKGAADLAKQRVAFEKLSESLYAAIKDQGGNKAAVYKVYCPMAFDNKGAFWLSEENAVKNPYFGDAMLNCGEVQEEMLAK